MKAAAILLDADKMDEAKVALYTALNTLVIETEVIPLPILRAEVMIAAAMTEDAKDEDKKSGGQTLCAAPNPLFDPGRKSLGVSSARRGFPQKPGYRAAATGLVPKFPPQY